MALNKTIKVTKLAEVLDGQMLETKRQVGDLEKKLRTNLAAVKETKKFIDTGDKRKVNPAYQELLDEQMKIRGDITTVREKRSSVEEALTRYDLLEGSREGRKYLEDATIEVSLSQMARWNITEDDVE